MTTSITLPFNTLRYYTCLRLIRQEKCLYVAASSSAPESKYILSSAHSSGESLQTFLYIGKTTRNYFIAASTARVSSQVRFTEEMLNTSPVV